MTTITTQALEETRPAGVGTGAGAGMTHDESRISGERLFRSFFMAGFECSAHRIRSGKRLDLVASTGHDRFALLDYERLKAIGIRSARDGIRWHRVETRPYQFDFTCDMPLIQAARSTGTQVIWDLCHYGWPDDLDAFSPDFVRRFAALARAFVRLLKVETDDTPYISPMNEASYVAWAGGAMALHSPFASGRGEELKRQLVRAAIAGTEAVWEVEPRSRIFHIEPICNVVADPSRPEDIQSAAEYNEAQYHVWDMIGGYRSAELGGDPRYLDVIGANYYIDNQWAYPGDIDSSTTISRDDPRYRPVSTLFKDVYKRYGRPLFVAETGIEDEARPSWFSYVCSEAFDALRMGLPMHGVCLYPILNHPGWEDDRHCYNGLWDYPDEEGGRMIYEPLAEAIREQQRCYADLVREPRPDRS